MSGKGSVTLKFFYLCCGIDDVSHFVLSCVSWRLDAPLQFQFFHH
ncbi:TPA: hypothetical protein ACXGFD_003974 [Enterobacter cloacae]